MYSNDNQQHLYEPWEHAAAEAVPIMWAPCLPAGITGMFHPEQQLACLRDDLTEPYIRLSLALAMAQRDIDHNGPHSRYGRDARRLALSRLVPDAQFPTAFKLCDGGVTALARYFHVPTRLIRFKLDTMRLRSPSDDDGEDGLRIVRGA